MKKSRILALLLAAMMCFTLTACGGSAEPAPEEPAPEAEGDAAAETPAGDVPVIKLGFIGPLTGGAALYGQTAERGAQIAVEEINAMGNVQIEFNAQDDEHDAERGIYAYGELQSWGAQAIVGAVTTTPTVAIGTDANVDRMFMLTPSATSTSVTEGKDNVYQLCFSDPNQGSASAEYIAENNIAKKIAVIYNNSDAYSTGIYQNFETAAGELGLEIVSVTTFTEDTQSDFSVQLQEAQSAGAELIFLPIYYTPASSILRQAADMNYAPKYFGCDGLDGILGIEGFDPALAEGLMLLTPFAADAEDAATKSFVEKYEAAHGEVPSQFAASGYDCVYAMYNAMQEIGLAEVSAMSSAELCEALIGVFPSESFVFDGLTGQGMTWKATGEVSKEPRAVTIQSGAYVGM